MDFLRTWLDYKNGFGDELEFWFGNDELHELTKNGDQELRIELVDNDGVMFAAEYDTFMVGNESSAYKLTVGGFKGCDPPGMFNMFNMVIYIFVGIYFLNSKSRSIYFTFILLIWP